MRCGRWGCRGWAAVPVDRVGMAFPWRSFAGAAVERSVVEDLQLAIDLAADGTPPRYCAPRASPALPDGGPQRGAADALAVGVLRTIAQAPRLVGRGAASPTGARRLAFELMVPRSRSCFRCGRCCWRSDGGRLLRGAWWPLVAAAAGAATCVFAIVLAWARFARDRVPASRARWRRSTRCRRCARAGGADTPPPEVEPHRAD